MISAVVTFGMIFLLLSSGRIYEGVKKLITLITDIILKLLNIFGLKLSRTQRRVFVSRKFKQTFKDIRIVKKSKQNTKMKPSINIFALILLIISVGLIVANLYVVSGNVVSTWLFEVNPIPQVITTQRNMDMTFTAVIFSLVTFSLSKLLNQWKDTAKYRKAKREMKKRDLALKHMSAKELLDAAKAKDLENYERLIKRQEENNV